MTKPRFIPATFMRGGTSKGLFFKGEDLPFNEKIPNKDLDSILLKIMGSPDPYGKQIDGMGGGSSSTSKVVIISESSQPNHDVDYTFGQVSVDQPIVDWSGNCGNLTAAAGLFSVLKGFIPENRLIGKEFVTVRLWQYNISKTIEVTLPLEEGRVKTSGNFELDGVTFPSSEITVDFINPIDQNDLIFPSGNKVDQLFLDDIGAIDATLINAGIPCIFVHEDALDLKGIELQQEVNQNTALLTILERIRRAGAYKMGLIEAKDDPKLQQHTPKIALVSAPNSYVSSGGKSVNLEDIDINVRAISMGKLHHALMATCAVATSIASEIPGTIVSSMIRSKNDKLRIGHPSGIIEISAQVDTNADNLNVKKVSMSRSARLLMDGNLFL